VIAVSEQELPGDVPGYVDPVLGWLPTTTRDQSCSVCGEDSVSWLHPLDPGKVEYREYGKGRTLPSFWTLCARCEDLYAAGADDELVALMRHEAGTPAGPSDEEYRRPLAVFRRADLGGRSFGRPPSV
jgi:hypothetical protein